jgi:hypothetical protein
VEAEIARLDTLLHFRHYSLRPEVAYIGWKLQALGRQDLIDAVLTL